MDDDKGLDERCPWVLVDQDFYAKRDYVSPLQEREWNFSPPIVRGIKKAEGNAEAEKRVRRAGVL